ncbi:kinectin-like [Xyrichtys novacula]|uniref:Kinectin-like n=1 Tax=Xyrichtys novacula TaxID=13765 RepID=A0AAV1G1P4_XYRNO|nr:kinectin-like [Xyrichtys novacula]
MQCMKVALEQQVKYLQEEVSRRAEETSIITVKAQELHYCLQSLNAQLETERYWNLALQNDWQDLCLRLEFADQQYGKQVEQLEELEAEKLALEQKVKELQEDGISRRAEDETSDTGVNQELQELVTSLKTQLQAEKNRAENLKREGEDLRSRLQIVNNNLTQLEAEKLAQEQKTEAEREERQRKEDSDKTEKVEELQQLVELFKTELQAEKNKTKTLRSEQEELRSSLQKIEKQNLKQANQSEAEKLVLEQTVRRLREETKNRAKTEKIYLAKIQTSHEMVVNQSIVLHDKYRMTDALTKQLKEVLDKRRKEMKLIEKVTTENEFLKQTVWELQEAIMRRTKTAENDLTTIQEGLDKEASQIILLQEKEQMADDHMTQMEDVRHQLLDKNSNEMKLTEDLTTENETIEETPEMEEISGATPETFEETPQISWWRRVKKGLTPKHRRQYKQRMSDQEMKTPTSP